MRRWMVLNGILGVIVLGLVIQVARTWMRTLPPVQVPPAAKAGEPAAKPGDSGKRGKRAQADKAPLTPAALVTAIAAKDLFDVSRQKPSDDVKVAAPVHETAPPPGVTLVGVRAWEKDREGFLLDTSQGNTQRRVRVGDAVGNFTVKRIRERSVLLVSQAGDEVTLRLERVPGSSAPAPPPPGGAPPRPGRPGGAQPTGAATTGSPAAGLQGTSPAAGVGGAPRTPGAVAPAPGQPAPGAVPGAPPAVPTPPAGKPAGGASQLPSAVRERLENLKKEQQRIQGMPQGGTQ